MSDYGTFRRHSLAVPFELIMLAGAVTTFAKGDYLHLLTSAFTFSISFTPLLVERWLRIRLPVWLQTAFVTFVFASMFAGEVFGMYARIWQWDDMAHFVSGILLGLGGIILLTELKKRQLFKATIWVQAILIIGIGMIFAVLWEVAEFTSDQLFGTFSQGGDLKDTMMDLIDDSTGALIMACLYSAYLKTGHGFGLRRLINGYIRLNS
jgi:hypothetical protein